MPPQRVNAMPTQVPDDFLAGCSKEPSSEAAGKSKPEAYPRGYVEDFDEPRTKLAASFNVLPLHA